MTTITWLADMIDHVPRVRVIKTTTSFVDDWYESEIDSINYEVKSVSIRNKSWLRSTFNFANVQFLTPVQYEWRYIGLWDKVNWKEVFDYSWGNTEWVFDCAKEYDSVYTHTESGIITFEPLHKLTPKIELSTEEMIDELKRRGVVTTGNIINN